MSGKLDDLQPDVLHIEGGGLAAIGRLGKGRVFTLLSAHDCLHLRFSDFGRYGETAVLRARAWVLSFLARRFERRWYRETNGVVVTSEVDRHALEEILGPVPVHVIPNGVDADYFAFKPTPRSRQLVFTGNMSWPPNEDAACHFATEILPRIRRTVGDVRFTAVGASPSPRVRRLGEIAGVTVTGTVPDLRRWIWDAEVYVSPLRFGAGIKNKILEAMALGTPVVASRRSLTGTPIVDGVQAFLADDPELFARRTIQLLTDAEARRRLSVEGRRLVESEYNWDGVSAAFERLYASPANDSQVKVGHLCSNPEPSELLEDLGESRAAPGKEGR